MNSVWLMSIADHLWQSTLFAGVAGVLTLALRKNGARVRHWVWVAASWKFLIPIALLTALGSHVPWHTTAAPGYPNFNAVIEEVTEPFSVADVSMPASPKLAYAPLPTVLTGLWACGILCLSFAWFVRWRRIRLAVRAGKPADVGIPIRAISSPALLEPGVFGIRRPVLLLPEGIFDRLPRVQMNAIVRHELCHVQHRDNLIAAIQMFVETLFWFHPLVWWIGTRMIDERERACDEEVVRTLGEPKAYAEAILQVCKLYVETPLACMAGISGSNLKRRIERILNDRAPRGLTVIRKAVLAIAAFSVVAGPVVSGFLHPSLGWAQAPRRSEQNAASLPRFEVASIKVSKNPEPGGNIEITPGRFRGTDLALQWLILTAYRIKSGNLAGNLPSWTIDERYSIDAKTDDASGEDRILTALQNLLKERFLLREHREMKEEPVYFLTIAKGGIKMPAGSCVPIKKDLPNECYSARNEGLVQILDWRGVPISDPTGVAYRSLAWALSGPLRRTVIDKTGLAGTFDVHLRWARDPEPAAAGQQSEPAEPSAPSIQDAVEKQLGLKLESGRGPVEYMIVDHVERPSEN